MLATVDHLVAYLFVNVRNRFLQYVVLYFAILVHLYYVQNDNTLFIYSVYGKRDVRIECEAPTIGLYHVELFKDAFKVTFQAFVFGEHSKLRVFDRLCERKSLDKKKKKKKKKKTI